MTEGAPARLRCRPIIAADVEKLVAFLRKGFPTRPERYWRRAFTALADRDAPVSYPRFGYLLERDDGACLGVLLTIFHERDDGIVRCNISSWHISADYRPYASLLVAAALRHKEVTYMNISPARHTWPIIEAQGFRRYCEGQTLAFPALGRTKTSARVTIYRDAHDADNDLSQEETTLMRGHTQIHGCIGLLVRDGSESEPFLFLPKRLRYHFPTLQLVYCRSLSRFTQYAANLGRALLRLGYVSIVVDSEEQLPGLPGLFFKDRGPKYFKGPNPPSPGDLTYTESILFGP